LHSFTIETEMVNIYWWCDNCYDARCWALR